MSKTVGVTQFLTTPPSKHMRTSKESEIAIKTHVDEQLQVVGMVYAPRGAGKATAHEVCELVNAGEQLIECIGNGDFFGNKESNIDAAVQATDRLDAAIQTLKAKGF